MTLRAATPTARPATTGVTAKRRNAPDGRERGGGAFSRGALFHLLKNRLYRGEIVHRGTAHPGLHEAIVDAELFEVVQAALADRSAERKSKPTKAAAAPLVGKIFDHDGSLMTPTFAYGKRRRSYRYYVSGGLQQGRRNREDGVVRRVSAPQIEGLVAEKMAGLARVDQADPWPQIGTHLIRVDVLANGLQITARGDIVGLRLSPAHLDEARRRLANGDTLERLQTGDLQLSSPVRPVFRGGRTWMVRADNFRRSTEGR